MKKINFTFLFAVLMSMVSAKAFAHDIEVKNADGVTIYYNFINNDTELAVSCRGNYAGAYSDEYTGNVVIPESVTYNGNIYNVTSIGQSAFSGCSGLTKVSISNNVTDIGNDAFYGCSGLMEVTIGNSVLSISDRAFSGCSGLTKLTIPNSVRSIGHQTFIFCSGLTEVTIGNSVTDIGDGAFSGCNSLIEVTIPNSVISIDHRAFRDCSSLTKVTIGDNVKSIGAWAFENCSSLTNLTIGDNVKLIYEYAFSGCGSLTGLRIPSSVTNIDDGAFNDCGNLEKIVVESGNLCYDSREDCNAIIQTAENKLIVGCKNTHIPNSVTAIAEKAFYGCSSLVSMTIPNSVKSIGDYVFYNCSSLEKIVVESGNLYYDSRENCNAIIQTYGNKLVAACKNTHIPNSIMAIGNGVFAGYSDLAEITIPNGVTTIGKYAFYGCSGLTKLAIPDNVTSIGEGAFYGCSGLTELTIGKSVTYIPEYALFGCDGLTTLYSLNVTPPRVNNNIYHRNFTDSQYTTVDVYVPQKALAAYISADVWKYFDNVQGIKETENETKKCAIPIIHYANNKLSFDCETEGVTFESKITDTDITWYSSSEIQLGVTYNISVYATKTGYENSDVATATLCWIDVEPKTEGIDTGGAQVRANAVLIQATNGQIDITGLADGTKVAVYGIDSTQIGSAVSRGGQASINTNMTPGSIAIVKMGDRSIKVVMK